MADVNRTLLISGNVIKWNDVVRLDLPELGRDAKVTLTSVKCHDEATYDSTEVHVITWHTARRTWLLDSTTSWRHTTLWRHENTDEHFIQWSGGTGTEQRPTVELILQVKFNEQDVSEIEHFNFKQGWPPHPFSNIVNAPVYTGSWCLGYYFWYN